VQDEAGRSIEDLGIFGGWMNFIGNFSPGEGYKVKVTTFDTLWIYESYTKSGSILANKIQTTHFITSFAGNGVDHMNLNLVDLPINVLNAGDELAVFDGSICVGAITLSAHDLDNRVVSIAVSAADNLGMKGFSEGDTYELRLWQSKSKIEQILHPVILQGSPMFVKNESAILSLKNFTGIYDVSVQDETINCYPNPFHKELIIEASLSGDNQIDIQVLNQLGQQVNYLVNNQKVNGGIHRWSWNGVNGIGQRAEPGIYYIRFSMNDKTVINKVVLTK
jgi:hypothetical protein